jgi:hypothetical protein
MKPTEVFLLPDPDVSELLASNETEMAELVPAGTRDQISLRLGSNPAGPAQEGKDRDVVSVMIASAALVVAATPLMKRALEVLSGRTVVVKEMELLPVETASGEQVKDASGQPILRWVERHRAIAREIPPQGKSNLSIEGPLGLKISFES